MRILSLALFFLVVLVATPYALAAEEAGSQTTGVPSTEVAPGGEDLPGNSPFLAGTETGGAQSLGGCPCWPICACNAKCGSTVVGCECVAASLSTCNWRTCPFVPPGAC